jgi:hypothetical protein
MGGEEFPMRKVRVLTDFVALYRGRTVSEAVLVAVSAEPQLVSRFVSELLVDHTRESEESDKEGRTKVVGLVHGAE